jgi:hypothetical protein
VTGTDLPNAIHAPKSDRVAGPAAPPLEAGDGVDRTLIDECLALSPAERLDRADLCAQELEALRELVRPRADT